MKIKYKKLAPEAKEPFRLYNMDAGFDMFATSMIETDNFIEYKTGIAFQIPEGMVGMVFPRSSITKYDMMLKNSVGIIDSSFRGEIVFRFVKVINELYSNIDNANTHGIYYEDGKAINIALLNRHMKLYDIDDRIGQIIFMPLPEVTLVESDELSNTERGEGGFGSTGVN